MEDNGYTTFMRHQHALLYWIQLAYCAAVFTYKFFDKRTAHKESEQRNDKSKKASVIFLTLSNKYNL